MTPTTRFADRTVIVTGASSGIGAGIARRFADEGANVVLVGRDRAKLDRAAAAYDPARSLAVAADIGVPADARAIVEAATARFGGIDVLVNNAGIAVMGRIDEVAPEDWQKVIQTDLTGTYLVTRAAWEALRASGGNVVNVSSVSGTGGDWGMFAYNAAKGGVTNLTRALALDAGTSGIRVNAVNPSFTRSDLTEDMFEDAELVAKFVERIPLGRPAEPEDIAGVVAFLASPDARFVNGVNLAVDGGLSASNGQPAQA
ncbi:SDR family NAD(P)-dependent oxidoreductase [Frigidibacter sp. MR17.24]|uniref:SDR family NAD(P)-dependent oxidoreductase n=1 Tax=Frigidibacter sp. MR17.24 TaxID=3127345 RepID=UPI003012A2FE